MIAEEVLTQHKQQVARIYNMAAAGYDSHALRFFPSCARRLVELAGLSAGQKILDVATGTGAAALIAAQKAGASGEVTGVDIAVEMLEQAGEKSRARGLGNIEWREMDAEHLDFYDHSFDAVISSCGIFFIPGMQDALREWLRVTRSGGRVAFSGFSPSAFQPQSDLFEARLRRYGVEFPLAHRPFSWQRLERMEQYEGLLTAAGCVQLRVYREQHGYFLSGADEWWQIICGSGFRGAIARLRPQDMERFKTEHLREVGRLATGPGIWLDVEAVFALGQKP
jgi:ubiquinone/menaquinone biosynthesis C-methylase UbiE